MRYYYEQDSLTEIYYIIDRYSDTHICDCFILDKVIWVTKALNEFEDRRIEENYNSIC